jgi:hypothetical protein
MIPWLDTVLPILVVPVLERRTDIGRRIELLDELCQQRLVLTAVADVDLHRRGLLQTE